MDIALFCARSPDVRRLLLSFPVAYVAASNGSRFFAAHYLVPGNHTMREYTLAWLPLLFVFRRPRPRVLDLRCLVDYVRYTIVPGQWSRCDRFALFSYQYLFLMRIMSFDRYVGFVKRRRHVFRVIISDIVFYWVNLKKYIFRFLEHSNWTATVTAPHFEHS